jgi:hypothetical protein
MADALPQCHYLTEHLHKKILVLQRLKDEMRCLQNRNLVKAHFQKRNNLFQLATSHFM